MAAIARPASSSGTQSGGEFFRYHGFRAPGVRLFRNLGFRAKAWVITASFVIPLALVGYHWFAAQAASIEFSAKEQLGVEYGQAAMGVLALAQQQRQLTLAAVAGHQDAAAIASVQARLDKALNALGALEARLGGELSTRSAFDAALAARRDVAAPEAGRERALQTHGAFAKAVMDLITAAADGSNLTLDPDIDTYYLMDAAYGALPGLTESVSNLGAMAAADAFGAARSEGAVKRVIATEALNATLLERLNGGLSKVQALHPDLAPALDSAPAGVSVRRLHELLGTTAPERQPVLGLVGDSANGLIALQRTTAAELDRLLGERVSRLETQRNVVGAVVALSLGVGAYLFYCFSIVMSGGLAHVQRHIDRIAEGDLTGEPIAWGRDEIGTVLDRLAGMRRQLAASIGTIRSSADEVATASAELSCGTVDLARRTEATAANLEKSASAMEQMQSTTRNTADTTREVAEVARDNAGMAQRGGTVIAQAVTTMQEIQDSSSKVADIIGVIDSIAFQTNILALNAAVEAARAGEQGKGFAVVAGEVRSLARRSAEAAREIKDLIASSVAKTESGAAVVQQAGDAMRQIVGSVERINALLAEVSAAATEQTEGIAHVNATVAEIDRSTQQNAALVEQTTAAARSMQQQAQSLASVAARFRIA